MGLLDKAVNVVGGAINFVTHVPAAVINYAIGDKENLNKNLDVLTRPSTLAGAALVASPLLATPTGAAALTTYGRSVLSSPVSTLTKTAGAGLVTLAGTQFISTEEGRAAASKGISQGVNLAGTLVNQVATISKGTGKAVGTYIETGNTNQLGQSLKELASDNKTGTAFIAAIGAATALWGGSKLATGAYNLYNTSQLRDSLQDINEKISDGSMYQFPTGTDMNKPSLPGVSPINTNNNNPIPTYSTSDKATIEKPALPEPSDMPVVPIGKATPVKAKRKVRRVTKQQPQIKVYNYNNLIAA